MAYLLMDGWHVFPVTFLLLVLLELVHTGFYVPGSRDEEPWIFDGHYFFLVIIIFTLHDFLILNVGKYSCYVLFPVVICITLHP